MSNIHAVENSNEVDGGDEPIDDEVAAIAVIVDAMGSLEPDAQARVIAYLNARYTE